MENTRALYLRVMLGLGFWTEFDSYLNAELENDSPLSDIALQLASCGSDLNAVISTLDAYIFRNNSDIIDYTELFCQTMGAIYTLWVSRAYSGKQIVEFILNVWDDVDSMMSSPWNYIQMLWYQEMDMSITGWSYQDLAEDFFSEISEWISV